VTPGCAGVGGESGRGDVVVAERVGDDRGGHVQDVLADGGAAAGDRGDAELIDESGQVLGV
jgi:hypothetical protein